jgi:glycosidase
MTFADRNLASQRPDNLTSFSLPRRESYFPSSADWRNEVLYFLLPDRFSDGQENQRPLLDRQQLSLARPNLPSGQSWRFDKWAESGSDRWQGGTIKGLESKLEYLEQLGVTTIWVGPIFKQRGHLDSYHGYGIQDFLEVDPRFGTRQDLVSLIDKAHQKGLRIILDIIFNHSGSNWRYAPGTPGSEWEPPYTSGWYKFGSWLGDRGQSIAGQPTSSEEGVWPIELQNFDCYTRAGKGDLGKGDLDDPNAEFRRSDFISLRDFQLDFPSLLNNLARCYKYWIALTDCDGFRIDTLKHVTYDQARNFCGTIKEFAANLGKSDFFLVGEVAGGDYNEDRYLDVLEQNLNAALDIGEMRGNLNQVAKGLMNPKVYFDGFDPGKAVMGSHRNIGRRHVSILDDHDHVFGEKIRFSSEAASEHQVVAGVALQLFTLGIPCIYAGTEQALAGPEPAERKWLPDWKKSDRYLREAMFGPEHPRQSGVAGLQALDLDLPGFGPFGTAGAHCFDPNHPAYVRIAAMAKVRKQFPVLRLGRQYLRPIAIPFLSLPFGDHGRSGEIVAWSRILDDEEAVCILNSHGTDNRAAEILVDPSLNPPGSSMTVILNTAQAATPGFAGPHQVGSTVPVQQRNGINFVEIQPIPASEFLILTNHP